MQSTRGAAILAAVAVLTGGLAACGADSEPQESTTPASPIDRSTDSTSSSESSSSSGSETSSGDGSGDDAELPDDLPPEARENTKEGAAAFGEYYLLTYGDAAKTGDVQDLQILAAKDCSVCMKAEQGIQDDKAKGWKRDKNPYTIIKSSATKRPDAGYKVRMDVSVAKHHRIDSDGDVNADIDATEYTVTEHVVWVDGRWQMMDWIVT